VMRSAVLTRPPYLTLRKVASTSPLALQCSGLKIPALGLRGRHPPLAAFSWPSRYHFGIFSGNGVIPSEADVGAFLHHGSVLRAEFRWRKTGRTNWKAEAYLEEAYEDARIKLVGTYNSRTRNLSYTLVWATCRVRSLDVGGPSHRNPDGEEVPTPHKHRWTTSDRDQWVYRPTDITSSSIRGIFDEFLTESNIRFEGTFFEPIEQGELSL
jgi:hypothetical protein